MKRIKGSALLWCLSVLIVLAVITMTAVMLSVRYYRNSVKNAGNSQAYYNSEAAAKLLRNRLGGKLGRKRVYFTYSGNNLLDIISPERNTEISTADSDYFGTALNEDFLSEVRELENELMTEYIKNKGKERKERTPLKITYNYGKLDSSVYSHGYYGDSAEIYIDRIDECDSDNDGTIDFHKALVIAETTLNTGYTDSVGAWFILQPGVFNAENISAVYFSEKEKDEYVSVIGLDDSTANELNVRVEPPEALSAGDKNVNIVKDNWDFNGVNNTDDDLICCIVNSDNQIFLNDIVLEDGKTYFFRICQNTRISFASSNSEVSANVYFQLYNDDAGSGGQYSIDLTLVNPPDNINIFAFDKREVSSVKSHDNFSSRKNVTIEINDDTPDEYTVNGWFSCCRFSIADKRTVPEDEDTFPVIKNVKLQAVKPEEFVTVYDPKTKDYRWIFDSFADPS